MGLIVRKTIAVAALALAGFIAPASAQVATYDSPTHVFAAAVQLTGEQVTVKEETIYTVPERRGFRVTDLVLSNWGIGSCAVSLPGKTLEVIVPVDETISVNFLSGPTYAPGERRRSQEHRPAFRPRARMQSDLYDRRLSVQKGQLSDAAYDPKGRAPTRRGRCSPHSPPSINGR